MTQIRLVEMKESSGLNLAVLRVRCVQGEADVTLPLPVSLFPGEPHSELIKRAIENLMDALEDWEDSQEEIA